MSFRGNKKFSIFILVLVLTVSLFLMVVPTSQAIQYVNTWVESFIVSPSTITIDESVLFEVVIGADIPPSHYINIQFEYYTPDGGPYFTGYVESDASGKASLLYTIPTVIVPQPIGIISVSVIYYGQFNSSTVWLQCTGGPVSFEVLPSNEPPVADADGPYNGYEGQAIIFDGSGSYDIDGTEISYQWDFGDGGTSIQSNPTHIYSQNGTYSVSLTVIDEKAETDIDYTTAIIADLNPTVNFSASPTFGPEPLTVTFTDSSTSYDGIISWLWDFGDGETSTQQNPIHLYKEGQYNVTLTVYEADTDTDSITKPNYINVTIICPSLILQPGWNMISFPCLPDDASFSSIFSDVGFYQVLTWDGSSYVTPSVAEAGVGYWVLVLEETTVTIENAGPVTSYTKLLPAGWSMIGSVYGDNVNADDVFPGFYQLLTWDGSGYITSTTIELGKGYWALVLEPTPITVGE